MNNLSQKILYKKNIQRHLSELMELSKKIPSEASLLPIETNEEIKRDATPLQNKPRNKFFIDFSEKESKRFFTYIKLLHENNSEPIYIWTPLADTCGLFEIDSILEFNFGFRYGAQKEGIISLLSKNLKDEMILDFFEDGATKKILEIELRGDTWPSVNY